jgi:hypothetical protein
MVVLGLSGHGLRSRANKNGRVVEQEQEPESRKSLPQPSMKQHVS